jgi:predicted transcriptional regulator
MDRRDRLQIIAEILHIARKGAKKTHIVYKANLNHALLEDYLQTLEEQGLISKNADPMHNVQTTQRGIQFVEYYRTLKAFANF